MTNALRFAVVVFMFSVFAISVSATDYQSTNFISRDPVLDDYGGISSASSFNEIQSGGQSVIGESRSSNFILRSGFLYFNEFTVRGENWRWYTDETNETPTSALAAENTAPTDVANADVLKLRYTIRELAGIASASVKFKLQYSTVSDFSSGVVDVVASASCTGTSVWCYADGAGTDSVVITTKVLSTSDACSGSSGNGCGTHNESGTNPSSFTHPYSAATEYEFTVKSAGPAPGTVYYFRAKPITGGVGVEPFTGKTYPSLTTQSAHMTFTVSGVAGGTSTEGVTTDVTTSTTSVPFGTLTAGTAIEAAQRLTMTTNAPNGYTVYLWGNPLLNQYADEIEPVSGTNASPAAWAIPGGQHGALGYHSGDALLAGGSTRFSADDTYAGLETTSREIIFNSGPPAGSEQTDVVYKIGIDALQPAGSYSATLQYIAVPVF